MTKVLIVDDDASFVESNCDLLEAYGYEVHSAPDGEAGFARALELIPDIIILDLMMTTETEGVDVARRIHGCPELARMGVMLVTGAVGAVDRDELSDPDHKWLPVDRVLEKPIDPGHLISELERVLEKRSGGKPNE